jgi:hypothetical protein
MLRPLMILCATMALACGVRAEAENMIAVADTFVTTNGTLGGYTSVHGMDSTIGVIGALCAQATPLIQFDLSHLTGKQVVGDASLNLRLVSSWNNATCTQVISAYEEHSSWSETTTNWDNLPGPGWWDAPPAPYGVMGPAILDSQTVTCSNGQPRDVSWTIPGSVVQSWIDGPADNHGLVLVSLTTPAYQDLWFSSREGGYAPQLAFSTVPEPSTIVLAGIAAIGLVIYLGQSCHRHATPPRQLTRLTHAIMMPARLIRENVAPR